MTRYSFMLHADSTQGFLEHIRELGVVDITTIKSWRGTETEESLFENSSRYLKIASAMKSFKPSGEKFDTIEEAVEAWESSSEQIADLDSKISKIEEIIKDIEIWGEFDKAQITSLEQEGIYLRYFVTSSKNYFSGWEQIYPLSVINRKDSKVYFVIASTERNQNYDEIKNATEVRAPEMTYAKAQELIEDYIADQKKFLEIKHRAAQSWKEIKQKALEDFDIYNFAHTKGSAEAAVEGRVNIFEGWSEKEITNKVLDFADREGVICFSEDAKIENNPPIKLKNNFFSRLYEPIGRLYMNPAYNELDLTPFFAPFFMIFFGMCLGDAGYGILFLLAVAILWKKIPAKFKDMAWLVIFLAIGGVIFGILGGNVFGIALAEKEAFIDLKPYMLLSDPINSFYFSVALGVIQVMFGQILRIFNRIKRGGSIVYGMSSIGWCLLFLGSMVAYVSNEMYYYPEIIGIHSIGYKVLLIVAGILILFFANPKANIFASFGKGLYSIYEMATGIIGDLISYVRLFAIGLAGAIIAQVFNELSIGLSPDIIVIKQLVMVIILVIGHGLNIFVSSLGAFVHPVRLTFVEFYKNAEFEGGGRDFKPFRQSSIED